jgi:hypothetical protein
MPTILTAVIGIICLATASARADDATALTELIDRHIQTRLDAEGLKRVPQAVDAEFLRRVFLDLHGVVPGVKRAAGFLDSGAPEKRTELIDELLASPRYGEYFGDIWSGRLISPEGREQRKQTERFTALLAERLNKNDGWNGIVSALLTATGKIEENPAVTYLIEGRHPLGVTDLTDLTSRYFLGIRLNCAQCHDHPFVAWKQADYWGMAAFFAQIQTPNRPKLVYVAGVQDDPKMTLSVLRDAGMIDGFQSRPPKFLGGEEWKASADTSHRAALARWMTSRDNPYFARAIVNRAWWHFFGRGIVNPVDDMHAGNPPSHPELLDVLSQRFIESGYDLKLLCRAITCSRTYQQTSRPGEQPEAESKWFARVPVKVLSPEQLYDSLVSVLGGPGKSPGIDTRLGARYKFCQYFAGDGDPDPTRYERGIPHLLRLMNSPQFASHNINALVARVAAGPSDDVIVEELFLTILSRRPTAAERQLVKDQLHDFPGTPETVYRQLAWALVMSSEFSLNH